MNRASALAWLRGAGFDPAMVQLGRDTGDTLTGYGPVIDRAFGVHAATYGLAMPLASTDAQYDLQLGILLEACAADLISIGYAHQVDISVDAPLTGLKMSQAWRQYNTLRERLWKEAGFYGYVTQSTVGGWAINLDHLEPSGATEFGP